MDQATNPRGAHANGSFGPGHRGARPREHRSHRPTANPMREFETHQRTRMISRPPMEPSLNAHTPAGYHALRAAMNHRHALRYPPPGFNQYNNTSYITYNRTDEGTLEAHRVHIPPRGSFLPHQVPSNVAPVPTYSPGRHPFAPMPMIAPNHQEVTGNNNLVPQPQSEVLEPRFDAPQPRFDAPHPVFNAPYPAFNAPQPGFDAPQPNVRQPRLEIEQALNNFRFQQRLHLIRQMAQSFPQYQPQHLLQFPGQSLPRFPGQYIPRFPGQFLPRFPGQSLPQLPGQSFPQFQEQSVPQFQEEIQGAASLAPPPTPAEIPSPPSDEAQIEGFYMVMEGEKKGRMCFLDPTDPRFDLTDLPYAWYPMSYLKEISPLNFQAEEFVPESAARESTQETPLGRIVYPQGPFRNPFIAEAFYRQFGTESTELINRLYVVPQDESPQEMPATETESTHPINRIYGVPEEESPQEVSDHTPRESTRPINPRESTQEIPLGRMAYPEGPFINPFIAEAFYRQFGTESTKPINGVPEDESPQEMPATESTHPINRIYVVSEEESPQEVSDPSPRESTRPINPRESTRPINPRLPYGISEEVFVARAVATFHGIQSADPAILEVGPWHDRDSDDSGVHSPQISPQTITRDVSPQLSPEDLSPQLTSGNVSSQLIPGDVSPQLIPANVSTEVNPGDVSPQLNHGNVSPRLNHGNVSPHLTPGNESPQLTPGNMSPQLNPENVNPQAIAGNVSPHNSTEADKKIIPEVVQEAIECTIQRQKSFEEKAAKIDAKEKKALKASSDEPITDSEEEIEPIIVNEQEFPPLGQNAKIKVVQVERVIKPARSNRRHKKSQKSLKKAQKVENQK